MDYIWKQIKKDIMPIPPQMGKYVYLDIIKILAAFLVVFYHYSFYSLDYGFAEGTPYHPNAARVVMSFAACSVPLFFMVNGALMLSRKRRLVEVYYKVGKITVLILCFRILKFPEWFFYSLAVLYLLYPLFFYLWDDHRNIYYSIIGIFLLFPFFYNEGTVILKLLSLKDFPITGVKTMYSVVYFLLGNVLFRAQIFSRKTGALLILAGMGLLLFDCIVLTNYNQAVEDGVNGAFPTLGALLLSLGLFSFFRSIPFKKRAWSSFFAQGILPIYLLHMFVGKYINTYLGKPTDLFFALGGSALICILCCCIGWILKKIPALCYFMKI